MSRRFKSLGSLAPAVMVTTLALTGCGDEGPGAEARAADSAFRDAQAAEAERYVDMQEGRAAQTACAPGHREGR
jgi:hypothetical protein